MLLPSFAYRYPFLGQLDLDFSFGKTVTATVPTDGVVQIGTVCELSGYVKSLEAVSRGHLEAPVSKISFTSKITRILSAIFPN